MYCNNCGSQIDDKAVVCPKCGVPVQGTKSVQSEKTNTMAIVGFVFSFFVSIVGLICSIMARKQCRKTREQGMGLATAGMIISIVTLVGEVIFSLIYVIVIATLLS